MRPFSAGSGIIGCVSESVQHDDTGGSDVDRRVAGDDDAPARITMRAYLALEASLIVVVERARRFVEQPDQRGCRD